MPPHRASRGPCSPAEILRVTLRSARPRCDSKRWQLDPPPDRPGPALLLHEHAPAVRPDGHVDGAIALHRERHPVAARLWFLGQAGGSRLESAAHREGDTQLTKTGYVIGSPKYMAPEQILGKKVDERADIYSLGVIMYEMFAGVPPYSRGDHMSVMYQHVQGKARQPIEINKALPVELNALVMKCMSLDKAKRSQSMDELRLSLEKFL